VFRPPGRQRRQHARADALALLVLADVNLGDLDAVG
jgi:hypothetical protein